MKLIGLINSNEPSSSVVMNNQLKVVIFKLVKGTRLCAQLSYLLTVIIFLSFIPDVQSAGEELKIKNNPYLQYVTTDGATLIWTTNKLCKSWVKITEPGGGMRIINVSEHGLVKADSLFRVRLSDLKPNTQYQYQVFSQHIVDPAPFYPKYPKLGAVVQGEVQNFRTLNPQKEAVRFVMVNDIHDNSNLLEQLLLKTDVKSLDFVGLNGDMSDYVNKQDDLFNGFLNKCTSMFAGQVPIIYARGNHEARGLFTGGIAPFFANEDNRFYYSYQNGPLRMLVLDCVEDKPDLNKEYGGDVALDEYIDKQAEWLKAEVNKPEFKNAPFRVIMLHMPLLETKGYGQRLRSHFLPILNQANVDLMICGHEHKFIFKESDKDVNFPTLVNDNKSIVMAEVTNKKIDVNVVDENGNCVLGKTFEAR